MIQVKEDDIVTPELYDLYPEFAAIGLAVGEIIPVGFAYGPEDDDIEDEKPPAQPMPPAPKQPHPLNAEKAVPVRSAPAAAAVRKQKTFNGQEIISDGIREVNGRKFHAIRIADGTSYDLTGDEYLAKVLTLPENE